MSAYYLMKMGGRAWKLIASWADEHEDNPKSEKGLGKEVRRLRELTEALCEDNQRLTVATGKLEERFILLRKWVIALGVILLGQVAAILWLTLRH